MKRATKLKTQIAPFDEMMLTHPWPWRCLPSEHEGEARVFDGKGREIISGDDLTFWRGITDAVNVAAFTVEGSK